MTLRKPSFSDVSVMGYTLYMMFTLAIDPDMFEAGIRQNPNTMYLEYTKFMGSEENVIISSAVLFILTVVGLFLKSYLYRIVILLLGITYFSVIVVSYTFNYPNIGLGIGMIIVIKLIFDANKLTDQHQEDEKQKVISNSLDIKEEDDDIKKEGE